MDAERNRISLGMKDFYVLEKDDTEEPLDQEADVTIEKNSLMYDTKLISLPESGFLGVQTMDVEYENSEIPILAQAESRASVPPLEVDLDDKYQENADDEMILNHEHISDADTLDEKSKRQAKKKAKKERLF